MEQFNQQKSIALLNDIMFHMEHNIFVILYSIFLLLIIFFIK